MSNQGEKGFQKHLGREDDEIMKKRLIMIVDAISADEIANITSGGHSRAVRKRLRDTLIEKLSEPQQPQQPQPDEPVVQPFPKRLKPNKVAPNQPAQKSNVTIHSPANPVVEPFPERQQTGDNLVRLFDMQNRMPTLNNLVHPQVLNATEFSPPLLPASAESRRFQPPANRTKPLYPADSVDKAIEQFKTSGMAMMWPETVFKSTDFLNGATQYGFEAMAELFYSSARAHLLSELSESEAEEAAKRLRDLQPVGGMPCKPSVFGTPLLAKTLEEQNHALAEFLFRVETDSDKATWEKCKAHVRVVHTLESSVFGLSRQENNFHTDCKKLRVGQTLTWYLKMWDHVNALCEQHGQPGLPEWKLPQSAPGQMQFKMQLSAIDPNTENYFAIIEGRETGDYQTFVKMMKNRSGYTTVLKDDVETASKSHFQKVDKEVVQNVTNLTFFVPRGGLGCVYTWGAQNPWSNNVEDLGVHGGVAPRNDKMPTDPRQEQVIGLQVVPMVAFQSEDGTFIKSNPNPTWIRLMWTVYEWMKNIPACHHFMQNNGGAPGFMARPQANEKHAEHTRNLRVNLAETLLPEDVDRHVNEKQPLPLLTDKIGTKAKGDRKQDRFNKWYDDNCDAVAGWVFNKTPPCNKDLAKILRICIQHP